MSFRLTNIHDYHRFIAVDMGFFRVRAGIYDLSSGEMACLGFSTVRQSRRNFSDGQIADIRGIAETIEQAIMQAGAKLETLPEDLIINFPSSNFVFDVLSTQYVRADKDSTLTMQEIDSMIKMIEKDSFERARHKSKRQFGVQSDDLRLISSTIVSIMIDGKKVTNPIGFSGARIRLTVLNVFVPSSEFNIVRSVVSSLGKRTISIIPSPLILPKYVEQTDLYGESACYVDVGYNRTTVVVTDQSEIVGFEVFPYGAESLLESLSERLPQESMLRIENILCNPSELADPKYQDIVEDFLCYLQDLIFGYLSTEHIDVRLDHLFLHGNIFENSYIYHELHKLIRESLGHPIASHHLYDIGPKKLHHDQVITHGLALMARELLLVKKDPLVRILRYVLYQYE